MINFNKNKIAIIGLGYVGLPLAVEFSKKFKVFGFDINTNRLNDLRNFEKQCIEKLNRKKQIWKNAIKDKPILHDFLKENIYKD